MAKGKYAVKSANRLAHTDNQLLRNKIAECERLKFELESVKADLAREQATAKGAIIRISEQRALEISEDRIAAIETRCRNEVREARESTAKVLVYLARTIQLHAAKNPGARSVPYSLMGLFSAFSPYPGELLAMVMKGHGGKHNFQNRAHRRFDPTSGPGVGPNSMRNPEIWKSEIEGWERHVKEA